MKRIQQKKQYELVIYLFTEGQKTEYQYVYDYIQKNYGDTLVRVIKKDSESDCELLMRAAISFEKELSRSATESPHQTWVVFDHDGKDTKVNLALNLALQHNRNAPNKRVYYALMKPCMEIWALMHFRDNFPENRIQIQKQLHRDMKSYDHENNPILNIGLMTKDRYEKACKLAHSWYNSLDDQDNPNSGCHYAGIYRLMQEIDKVFQKSTNIS